MDLGQTRCEDKPSPAGEHAVPSSRAEMLIRTISETKINNGQLCQKPWASQIRHATCGDEIFLGKIAMFTKDAFLYKI